MELWITQLFNGISYAALCFMINGGLSLIFGMMRIVNMTHGSYYLLGGYVGLTVIWQSGHFLLAILAGALAIALLGVVEWGVFLRRLGGQELGQVLTTMGIALIFQDLGLVIWGGEPHTIRIPAALSGSYHIGSLFFPVYRLFIIAVALMVGAILWVVLERTRLGAMIRSRARTLRPGLPTVRCALVWVWCPRAVACSRRSPSWKTSWWRRRVAHGRGRSSVSWRCSHACRSASRVGPARCLVAALCTHRCLRRSGATRRSRRAISACEVS